MSLPLTRAATSFGSTPPVELLEAGSAAERGDLAEGLRIADAIAEAHRAATPAGQLEAELVVLIDELRRLLEGVSLLGEQTPRSRAVLASLGPRPVVRRVAHGLMRSAARRVE